MAVTAQQVKDLREATGAGPLDCKKALESTNGDVDKAIDLLREKGLARAAKKLGAGRVMNEGVIETYQHFNRRLGVMVEVNCETDFVANTEQFRAFAKDIALHIANMNPEYIKREDVPEAVVEAERQIQRRRAIEEGKPEAVADKVVDGRMGKFFEESGADGTAFPQGRQQDHRATPLFDWSRKWARASKFAASRVSHSAKWLKTRAATNSQCSDDVALLSTSLLKGLASLLIPFFCLAPNWTRRGARLCAPTQHDKEKSYDPTTRLQTYRLEDEW